MDWLHDTIPVTLTFYSDRQGIFKIWTSDYSTECQKINTAKTKSEERYTKIEIIFFNIVLSC